jgi:AAA15 family ATPase/GTPase
MKICSIYITEYRQFHDIGLNFTDGTGKPLSKICFIGQNGTGKSTLLNIIFSFLQNLQGNKIGNDEFWRNASVGITYYHNSGFYHVLSSNGDLVIFRLDKFDEDFLKNYVKLFQEAVIDYSAYMKFIAIEIRDKFNADFSHAFTPFSSDGTLFVYSPAESSINGYKNVLDVPATNVNEALEFSKSFPDTVIVSPDTVTVFWKLLVYNLRKRAEERDAFENLPENLKKTKEQLIVEFDKMTPKVLEHLDTIWNKILQKAGLYFDVKGASNPYQLTDNLKAYIKLKNTNSIIPYSELSTGIRNYIFRLGHIFSLYFDRQIDRGFLLVDEPENSLYPDFLFDLVEAYQHVVIDKRDQNNTQMFFATHNPIIAAQFQPHERIILEWKDNGTVEAKKGVSPVGDDPNDVLSNDFELKNLMGPEGRKMWEEYIGLKKKLIKTKDDDEKSQLIHDIEKIGSLYNFS